MKTIKILFKKFNIIDKLFVALSLILFFAGSYELLFEKNTNTNPSDKYESELTEDINIKEDYSVKEEEQVKEDEQIKEDEQVKDKDELVDNEQLEKEEDVLNEKEDDKIIQLNDENVKDEEQEKSETNDNKQITDNKAEFEKESIKEDKVDNNSIKEGTTEVKKENDIAEKEHLSDKEFKKLSKSKPDTVKGDYTGNYRVIKIKTNENIVEYCYDYYKNNFNDDYEIHSIINTKNNTITTIEKLTYTKEKRLTITVREYSKKEEKKWKTLNTGNILKTYWINLDTKVIEEFDSNDLENKAVEYLDSNDIRHKDIIKYRVNNILKNQFKDNIKSEATLDYIRVNENGSIKSLSYDDCIVLVDLTWKKNDSINMTRKMVEFYSNQFAIEIAKELENQSEIVFFWNAEYTDISLKHTYNVVNKKAYVA